MSASRRTASQLSAAAALAAAALVLGACASAPAPAEAPHPPRYGDRWAHAPGAVPMGALSVPDEVRDLVLTVYPSPRRADYGEFLLPLDGARTVTELDDDVDARLLDAGLELGTRELPPEGYALAVESVDGRTVVVTVTRDEPGRAWASQALDQLTTTVGGRPYVRVARVLDAPVFRLRGNKRPQEWERRYRANFGWEVKDQPEYASLESVATYAPGSPLDATPEAVDRILGRWRVWMDRGVTRFCVKFDDVGFEMTPDTERRFGTYAAAVRSLVSALRAGLRERDDAAVLYFLPQTYWWHDRRMGAYARAIRAAGGFEPDVGLVMTGPEIISETIDAAGLAGARDQFGSIETPALIYDNRGREGDWGPLDGRDPALATLADGVFGERGTPVNRLTRLDWLWNPAAYDPERSWRRALLELAGPAGFEGLRDACAAFRRGAPREEAAALVARFAAGPPLHGPLPRTDLTALLQGDLSRLASGQGDSAAARP